MKDKIAVVTGAGSGIGKAIALQLLEAGAIVVNADIFPPAYELPKERYIFCQTDLKIGEEVQQLYQNVNARAGVPDILVCNAGIGIHEKLSEGDPEKWQTLIDTNLMGTLRILRAFLPSMMEKESGDIVFISSVAANQAYAYGGIYAASKAAIDAVTATLRLEVKDKIRVISIAPGVVDTPFFNNLESSGLSVESIGFGSLDANDVADAVLFALSRNRYQLISNITLKPTRQTF